MKTLTASRSLLGRALGIGITTSALALGGTASAAPQPHVLPPVMERPNPAITGEKISAPATHRLTMNLDECIRQALERQPAVKAARASLASAAVGYAAIAEQQRCIAKLIAPDLPIRLNQAALGVSVAKAEVAQAETDAIYNVTRLYYTAVYARQQEKLADETLGSLKPFLETLTALAKTEGSNRFAAAELQANVAIVEAKRAEAIAGSQRALSALREAIGLEPNECIEVADTSLPWVQIDPSLTCETAVALALQRRGEIQQSQLAHQVTQWEVHAQKAARGRVTRTFAAGSDIHTKPLPAGNRNGEYAPAAVGLEFPTSLVGSSDLRANRACQLSQRAGAVAEKTRNLIVLEVEAAILKYREAANKVYLLYEPSEQTKASAAEAARIFRDIKDKELTQRLIGTTVSSAQARALLNQAVLDRILAAANLRRATGGAIEYQLIPAPHSGSEAKDDDDDDADKPETLNQ